MVVVVDYKDMCYANSPNNFSCKDFLLNHGGKLLHTERRNGEMNLGEQQS